MENASLAYIVSVDLLSGEAKEITRMGKVANVLTDCRILKQAPSPKDVRSTKL